MQANLWSIYRLYRVKCIKLFEDRPSFVNDIAKKKITVDLRFFDLQGR